MTDEPKTPGADITDGATGNPYMQADEKSAGQRAYEAEMVSKGLPSSMWHSLTTEVQKRYEFNATVTPSKQTIKAP